METMQTKTANQLSLETIEGVLAGKYWRTEYPYPRTKADWRAFQSAVKASLGCSTAHLVRWNTSWCDSIDVSITLAPD